MQVNNQLAETLADDRFITAFIGLLDPRTHIAALSQRRAGTDPAFPGAIAAPARATSPTSFPLARCRLPSLRPAVTLEMLAPGDMLVLLSDGIYEYGNAAGEQFGEDRVEAILARPPRHVDGGARRAALLDAVQASPRGAPQEDDITVVLVKREARAAASTLRSRAQLRLAGRDLRSSRGRFLRAARSRPGACSSPSTSRWRSCSPTWSSTAAARRRAVDVDIATIAGGVEVTLTDYDVDRFDVTEAPDATSRCRSSSAGRGPGLAPDPTPGGLHRVRVLGGRAAKPHRFRKTLGHVSDARCNGAQTGTSDADDRTRCRDVRRASPARLDATQCGRSAGLPRSRPRRRDPRLQRPGVHLQRRPRRPPEDAKAAARGRRASCA